MFSCGMWSKVGPTKNIISVVFCQEGLDNELSLRSFRVQASATRGKNYFPVGIRLLL